MGGHKESVYREGRLKMGGHKESVYREIQFFENSVIPCGFSVVRVRKRCKC
jgi:hypothetical protein